MPEGNDGPAEGSEKTLTQDQVDKIVEERLARERKKYADYDDLKSQVEELKAAAAEKSKEADASKSETEKLTEQLQSLQSQVDEERTAREKAELQSLRAQVAQAKGLKPELANRLSGSTKEELEEDADSILEVIGGKEEDDAPKDEGLGGGRPREKLTPGASSDDDDQVDYEGIADRIAQKNRI